MITNTVRDAVWRNEFTFVDEEVRRWKMSGRRMLTALHHRKPFNRTIANFSSSFFSHVTSSFFRSIDKFEFDAKSLTVSSLGFLGLAMFPKRLEFSPRSLPTYRSVFILYSSPSFHPGAPFLFYMILLPLVSSYLCTGYRKKSDASGVVVIFSPRPAL